MHVPRLLVIRAGLIDAKMNQLQRVAVITRSTHRVFGDAQWRQLRDKLDIWRSNLGDILAVLDSGRQHVGPMAQSAEETVVT